MEITTAGVHVTTEPKRLVNGLCWNLNCLNPCPVALHRVFWSVEKLQYFKHAFVMSVETGSMFLRITQNQKSVQILCSVCRALVR